jgi:hypothetical protein
VREGHGRDFKVSTTGALVAGSAELSSVFAARSRRVDDVLALAISKKEKELIGRFAPANQMVSHQILIKTRKGIGSKKDQQASSRKIRNTENIRKIHEKKNKQVHASYFDLRMHYYNFMPLIHIIHSSCSCQTA